MSKKRADGEGTIYKSKYKNKKGEQKERWVGQITYGYNSKTGKLMRKSFYGKGQKEVKDKIKEALKVLEKGTFVHNSKSTFGEWLEIWLNNYSKPTVRPSTWESYKTISDVHIIPALGMIPLAKLKAADLQRFYNEKLKNGRKRDGKKHKDKNGLSTRYVRHMHSIIRKALQQAFKENMVHVNIADAAEPPTVKTKEMQPLTEEQVSMFLETAKDDRLIAAYLVALSTGVRRGELLGLKWDCVDLKEGAITIKRQLLSLTTGSSG